MGIEEGEGELVRIMAMEDLFGPRDWVALAVPPFQPCWSDGGERGLMPWAGPRLAGWDAPFRWTSETIKNEARPRAVQDRWLGLAPSDVRGSERADRETPSKAEKNGPSSGIAGRVLGRNVDGSPISRHVAHRRC